MTGRSGPHDLRGFSQTELRALAGLVDGQTLVEIGRELQVGYSAISKALRGAERRAGVQLFEYDGRRLRLTAAGADIARAAVLATEAIDSVDQAAERLRSGARGVARILSSPTPADFALPPILSEFLGRSPEARVSMRVASMLTMHRELEEGDYDLAVGRPMPVPRGWYSEALYEDELVLFVAAGSDLSGRDSVFWDEVREHVVVGHFQEPSWDALWMQIVGRAFDAPYAVEFRTSESVKRLVASTNSVGILVRSAIARELDKRQFEEVVVAGLSPLRAPYSIYHRRTPPPLRVVEELRDLLIERLRGFASRDVVHRLRP